MKAMDSSLTIVILAAGLGTRMKSKKAKVLHKAGGLTLVENVVLSALTAAPKERVFVVTGHQAEDVENVLQPYGVRHFRQTEQKGTGHALRMGEQLLRGFGGRLVVLYGDTPLLSEQTLRALLARHEESGAQATVITTLLEDPFGYGRIVLDQAGEITAIVEHKAAMPEQLNIREINSGIYCFEADLMWKHIGEITTNNPAGEYYLTDMIEILRRHGGKAVTLRVEDPSELLGINSRVELAVVDRILRERKARDLMLEGVTIEKPDTVTIDRQVRIGRDTIVGPFTQILGASEIGEDCVIGAGSILESSRLEDSVTVKPYSYIGTSVVETGAQVGPFARLRQDNHVGAGAHIGNFVELKKTRMGAKAKANHLAYLGDSEIGEKSNIGAGTITCNYDGVHKHQTKIGAEAFIGSNSTLVAPIALGDGSYVAAGSVITLEVPPETLAFGRARQTNKEGYAAKLRKKA
jgi:bifunctional UDP-N-acetylglucosamine pyrophosphorylase/glucosamine-1-phosphate N-acetyltransferase